MFLHETNRQQFGNIVQKQLSLLTTIWAKKNLQMLWAPHVAGSSVKVALLTPCPKDSRLCYKHRKERHMEWEYRERDGRNIHDAFRRVMEKCLNMKRDILLEYVWFGEEWRVMLVSKLLSMMIIQVANLEITVLFILPTGYLQSLTLSQHLWLHAVPAYTELIKCIPHTLVPECRI